MLLLVAGFFGALELVTRAKLFPASRDLRNFMSYPARAAALAAAPPPRVAFIGNSLTGRGIDAALFGRELGVSADVFVADSSHIDTWIWMMTAEFWKRHLRPDLLIVHFYENDLEDGKRLEIGRLAQFFTDLGDVPALFRDDLRTLDERVEYLLSAFWATFAVRDRIKERVLDLIPGYQDYVEVENAVNYAHDQPARAATPGAPRRTVLARFLARARASQTRVLFVAFPTRPVTRGVPPYPLDPDLVAQIRAAGMGFLDLRVVPELDPTRDYADDIHLDEAGRERYTERLVTELRRMGLPWRD